MGLMQRLSMRGARTACTIRGTDGHNIAYVPCTTNPAAETAPQVTAKCTAAKHRKERQKHTKHGHKHAQHMHAGKGGGGGKNTQSNIANNNYIHPLEYCTRNIAR